MCQLNFYRVKEEYIEYLKEEETKKRGFTKVSDIKYSDRNKFTFGTVLEINGFKYYVSVSSFKIKQEANILIKIPGDRVEVKGSLRFNFMIPVPSNCLEELIIANEEDLDYKLLLNKEYNFCMDNKDKIIEKANKIYKKVIKNQNQKLTDNSCDFKLLEQAYSGYSAREEVAVTIN
jgi:protein AbiQ